MAQGSHAGDETPTTIRVLHVDDDRSVADLTAASLKRLDDKFRVSVETDPRDALEEIGSSDVDCIVSDYQMPGLNGLELLDAVRSDYSDLPFILYTGEGSETIASEALSRGATDYLRKGGGQEQYELLANRITNSVTAYRRLQHASSLERVSALVREINQSLIRASSRREIEVEVCDIISSASPYGFAWFGRVDPETNEIEPVSWAGVDEQYIQNITVTTDRSETGQGPGGRAVRNRCVEVSQNIHTDSTFEPWRDTAAEQDVRSVAAVPITHGEQLYGLLVVGAERAHAFDRDERELLEELGDDIAHAIDSLRIREEIERESDQRAALFENAPDPIVEVEFDGEIPYISDVNGAFEETFGFPGSDVTGRQVSEVLVPESESSHHDTLRQRVVQGDLVETEVRRQTASGDREFLLRIVPFDVTDISGGAYAWYTDITERKQYENRLEHLNEATPDLMTANTVEDVADITVAIAQRVLDQPLAAMWSYEADGEVLRPLAVSHEDCDLEDSRAARLSSTEIEAETVEMDVFEKGELAVIEEYRAVESPAYPDLSLGTVLIAPLGRHGLLAVASETVREVDDTTLGLFESLCQTAAAALERVDRERTLNELNGLTRDLVRAPSVEEIASIATEAGEELLGLSFTHLYLQTDDGETLRPVAASDDMSDRFSDLPDFPRGEGLLWDVLESGEPRLYDDVQREARLASEMPFRGAVLVPLGERGVFASGSMEPATFDPFDQKLVSILAATTEVAIERAEREQRLRAHEQELTAARNRFRSIFEHSNDAILIFDPEADEFLEANPRATTLLGYSREELLTRGPSDIHPHEMDKFREFVDTIDTAGTARTDRLSCVTESGEQVPAEISASTLEFDGRDSVLALIRDMSDLREYERELERQNERLENFANVISHDLRNPLNVATGHVELAKADCDSDHLEPVQSALERMEEMIQDLLALTRAAGSVEETDRVSLEAIVQGCWQNVATESTDLVVETESSIVADESRLRHVFENLFRNAIEHADSDVTITVGELSDRSGFYVADSGPGIPPEEHSNIFAQGYSTAEDGTGFGLSIVKEIVEAHGWTITITESDSGGARFEIRGVEFV
jgi:PAS domain S-box-containing protein